MTDRVVRISAVITAASAVWIAIMVTQCVSSIRDVERAMPSSCGFSSSEPCHTVVDEMPSR